MEDVAVIISCCMGSMDGILINRSRVREVYSTNSTIQLKMLNKTWANQVYSRIKEYFPSADVRQLENGSVLLYTESKPFVMIHYPAEIFISKFQYYGHQSRNRTQ